MAIHPSGQHRNGQRRDRYVLLDGPGFRVLERGNAINNFPLATSSTDVLDGQWHHVAGTWDGALIRIFVDGTPQAQAALTTPFNNTRPVNLGYSWGGGSPTRFFRGKVNELAIYRRALTPNEVAALFTARTSGKVEVPSLEIAPVPSGVRLSWEATPAGWGLVSRPDLTSAPWDTVTNEPSRNGARNELLLPVTTTAQRFFRLQWMGY